MKATLSWKQGMLFEATNGQNQVNMDAKPPVGQEKGMTPKELVAAGLAGCTAMDVTALLKKHKQTVTQFEIDVQVQPTSGKHPHVFESVHITFQLHGEVDPAIALESVRLSQTKFCGVSAMLSKACPIFYKVMVNGTTVGEGQAQFE